MFSVEDNSEKYIQWDSQEILVSHDDEKFGVINDCFNPAPPLEFPSPSGLGKAARNVSNVLDPVTMEVISQQKIIYRRPSSPDGIPQRAYFLMNKMKNTIHGYLYLCRILKRSRRRSGQPISEIERETNDASKNRNRSYAWYWEVTSELAVLKFSSWSKMHKYRGRHLSEPLRELCAKQLLGNYHDHILGTLDTLNDDFGLYLFLPYCNGGDLYGNMTIQFRENKQWCLLEHQARFWFRQLLLVSEHDIFLRFCNGYFCRAET